MICFPCKTLKDRVRIKIRKALKRKKNKRTLEYLGCSTKFYHSYLEKQFVEGMNWGNYGNGDGKWNIDHITPVMLYDENGNPPSIELVIERLHYSNTQPSWFEDNMKKGNRFDEKKREQTVSLPSQENI